MYYFAGNSACNYAIGKSTVAFPEIWFGSHFHPAVVYRPRAAFSNGVASNYCRTPAGTKYLRAPSSCFKESDDPLLRTVLISNRQWCPAMLETGKTVKRQKFLIGFFLMRQKSASCILTNWQIKISTLLDLGGRCF